MMRSSLISSAIRLANERKGSIMGKNDNGNNGRTELVFVVE